MKRTRTQRLIQTNYESDNEIDEQIQLNVYNNTFHNHNIHNNTPNIIIISDTDSDNDDFMFIDTHIMPIKNEIKQDPILIHNDDSDTDVDIECDFEFNISSFINDQSNFINNLNNNINFNLDTEIYNSINPNVSIFCFEKCHKKCGLIIGMPLVRFIQQNWKCYKYAQQQNFIASLLIPNENGETAYALPVGHGRCKYICSRFLTKLLKVSSKRLTRIASFRKKNWNALPPDRRGQNLLNHLEKYDKDAIRNHILSFPR